jgi:hypothetical protein
MPERVEVHMRDSDAFSWYMEKDPLLRSTVVCVLLLDGSPDWDRLPERLERSTRQSPGFRHRVVMPPLRLATPRWVVDPDFDLSWHVRRFEAASPKTLATVLEFARKTGMAGLDRDRPLWEFTFIEGLDSGQTALVIKLHHSLTDGVGGIDIARLAVRRRTRPGRPRTDARRAGRRASRHRRPGARRAQLRLVAAVRLRQTSPHLRTGGRPGPRLATPRVRRSPRSSRPARRSHASSNPCQRHALTGHDRAPPEPGTTTSSSSAGTTCWAPRTLRAPGSMTRSSPASPPGCASTTNDTPPTSTSCA